MDFISSSSPPHTRHGPLDTEEDGDRESLSAKASVPETMDRQAALNAHLAASPGLPTFVVPRPPTRELHPRARPARREPSTATARARSPTVAFLCPLPRGPARRTSPSAVRAVARMVLHRVPGRAAASAEVLGYAGRVWMFADLCELTRLYALGRVHHDGARVLLCRNLCAPCLVSPYCEVGCGRLVQPHRNPHTA